MSFNPPPKHRVTKIPVNFDDDMMEVIAVIIQTSGMTYEEYASHLTDKKIKAMNKALRLVFMRVHQRGIGDARKVYQAARGV